MKDIFAFRYEDFVLEGYDPHPHIKAEVLYESRCEQRFECLADHPPRASR